MTLGQDCLFGIPSTAVQALVDGRHGDPFSILGPHQCGSMSVVRVLAPGAQKIEVVAREDSSWLGRLELAHPGGLFAGPVVGDRPYRLVIQWPEAVQETEDPYSFGMLLGELDLHLIAQGTHYELARCLGAQTLALGGVQGVRFAVWAPNARRVSVVGDFNTWDGRRHPMRLRREAGVWELFIPRIGAGALYKHELLGPDGALLPQKADPVARASEGAPGTASIVASSAPFAWTDQAWIAKRSLSPSRQERPKQKAGLSWSPSRRAIIQTGQGFEPPSQRDALLVGHGRTRTLLSRHPIGRSRMRAQRMFVCD